MALKWGKLHLFDVLRFIRHRLNSFDSDLVPSTRIYGRLSTCRRHLGGLYGSKHFNMLSTFRCDVGNIEHLHFGGSKTSNVHILTQGRTASSSPGGQRTRFAPEAECEHPTYNHTHKHASTLQHLLQASAEGASHQPPPQAAW